MTAPGKARHIGFDYQGKAVPFCKSVGFPGVEKNVSFGMGDAIGGKDFPCLLLGAAAFAYLQGVVAGAAAQEQAVNPGIQGFFQIAH